jgi:hypothetical protein
LSTSSKKDFYFTPVDIEVTQTSNGFLVSKCRENYTSRRNLFIFAKSYAYTHTCIVAGTKHEGRGIFLPPVSLLFDLNTLGHPLHALWYVLETNQLTLKAKVIKGLPRTFPKGDYTCMISVKPSRWWVPFRTEQEEARSCVTVFN